MASANQCAEVRLPRPRPLRCNCRLYRVRFTYKSYLLVILSTVLALSYAERTLFGLSLQEIKVDIQLSDTELGFLGGLGFTLFYSFIGLPIARWADRGNRITILSLTTAIFGIAVSLYAV